MNVHLENPAGLESKKGTFTFSLDGRRHWSLDARKGERPLFVGSRP